MDERVRKRLERLKADAAAGGYHINPDEEFTAGLVEGLLANADRYGVESCPCRLLTGDPRDSADIVCPCDYRDDDLAEYGACFCALYVDGASAVRQAPDRRPPAGKRAQTDRAQGAARPAPGPLPYPVYRCPVCGYLCANTHPPRVCPVCKASGDRFERFM